MSDPIILPSVPPDAKPPADDDLAHARKELEAARREAAAYRVKLREYEAKDSAVLAEQGKWKELAEATQAKLAAAQSLGEVAQKYEARMAQAVAADIEQLPQDLRDIMPIGMTVADQFDFLPKLKALAAKVSGAPPIAPPRKVGGPPPLVQPLGTGAPADAAEWKRRYMAASQEERARVDRAMRAGDLAAGMTIRG